MKKEGFEIGTTGINLNTSCGRKPYLLGGTFA